MGPLGAAQITLLLSDLDDGRCRLEMAEVAVTDPARLVPNRLQLRGIWPRNAECTRRLAGLAERRVPEDLEASGNESSPSATHR